MKNLKKILGTATIGLALASTDVSGDLIKWKTDTENTSVRIDTVTREGHSQIGSWNPTPFYGESIEYYLLGGNKKNNDYFGTAIMDFFNVKIDGRNNVTDYQITIEQDTNLDGTMDYQATYSLKGLLAENNGQLSLAPCSIPKKSEDYIGKMTILAIPEPTAAALIGFGGIGTLALNRLRIRRSTAKKYSLDYSALDSIDFPKKK